MIHNIALSLFLGQPLVMYGGVLTFLLLLTTAAVGLLNRRGIFTIQFKWHSRLALATVIIGAIHGILGLSILLNF